MRPSPSPSDEMLVAFLDGELDPEDRQVVQDCLDRDAEVAARFDILRGSELPFAAAFDGMLAEAPLDRLRTIAAAVPDLGFARLETRPTRERVHRRQCLVAAGCLAAGIALDRSVAVLTGGMDDHRNWRDVVANYMSLYSPETLGTAVAGEGPDPREMARLSNEIGVDLSLSKLAIAGIPIRRAQMLSYRGASLVQIAYLDQASGPLAFCVIRQVGTDKGPQTERRYGLTVVHWSSQTHAFLVVGHADAAALEVIAQDLRERVLT